VLITYGSSSEALARAVANQCNAPLVRSTRRLFPDGEQYVQVSGDLYGEDVVLIHSLALNPDPLLVEYLLLADAIRSAGCRSLTVVIPYLAYLRQDSRFKPGEPLSAKVIASLIESPRIDRLITIDAHLHRFRSLSELFITPSLNLSAMPLLADYYLKNFGNLETLVVGPDAESEQRARGVAEHLSSPYIIMEKKRLGDREVIISGGVPVKGKNVVIVDDIVSTGATLAKLMEALLGEGAGRVDALVTHALLVEDSYQKLTQAGLRNLISTDTVPTRHSKVSVAPLVSKALEGLS